MRTAPRTTLLPALLLALAACLPSPAGADGPGSAPALKAPAPTAKGGDVKRIGAAVPATAALPIDAVLADPDGHAGKRVVVSGKVRKVCQSKGCWMELGSASDEKAPTCWITFKDYAFFMPVTTAGKTAKLEGLVSVKTLPKEQVAHLEAEGASFAKGKDGSARKIAIEASGVELGL